MSSYIKKIGIDARYLLVPMRGMPLYVTKLCQLLPAMRRDYLFYLFINKGYEHNDSPKNYQDRLDAIKLDNHNVIIINREDDAELVWEQVYLPRMVKEYGLDLLHMPGNRAAFFPGTPIIVTVHDVMELHYIKNTDAQIWKKYCLSPRRLFYEIRRYVYIWTNYTVGVRKCEAVITVSDYSAQDIVKTLRISPAKVNVIYHGLDPEFLPPVTTDKDDCKLNFGTRHHVLMLGGDSYHKNPVKAIEAWAGVASDLRMKYPLKIVGFCGSEESPLIRALYKFKLVDEVEIHSWITQDQLIRFMQQSVLFLYLSRYEGFGFPLLNAMASGTPVVSTNRSSIPEVLGNVGVQLDPDDHEGVSRSIEKLLCDGDLWRSQSVAGIKRARQFDWNKSIAEHLRVYEKVMR